MGAREMKFWAGIAAAALIPLSGCDRQESTQTDTPEFQSASQDTADCCAPDDAIVTRVDAAEEGLETDDAEACCEQAAADASCCADESASASEVESDGTAEIIEPFAETVAQIGSIQTSIDESVLGTIIGRRPNLDLDFTNEDGQEVNLARDYAGQTIVLTTVFTSCPTPTACPRITADFAEMARRMPAQYADKVRFVLVSFDPANDTPEVLKVFGRKHGVDFDRVDLLVSDVATTKRLMLDELEIPIQLDDESGNFSNHALMVHVINADGFVVVERTAGSSAKISMLLDEAIRAATLPFTAPDNGG